MNFLKNANYPNYPIQEAEFVVTTFLQRNLHMQMAPLVTTAKRLRGEKMTPILENLSKTSRGGTIANSFYDVSSTLLLTPKRKLQTDIPHEHRCKNPKQNISNSQPATHYNKYTPCPSRTYPRKAVFKK